MDRAENNPETDFYVLNMNYLNLLREVARIDVGQAVARFGLSRELVELIKSANIEILNQIANSEFLIFGLRSNQSRLVDVLKLKDSDVARSNFLLSTISN